MSREGSCAGLVCECDDDGDAPFHGETFESPCDCAVCYHCGWAGSLPVRPKALQAWERKALNEGWTPPAHRLTVVRKS